MKANKFIISVLGILLTVVGSIGLCSAQSFTEENNFHYKDPIERESNSDITEKVTEYGQLIKEKAVQPEESLLNRLLGVFQLDSESYHGPQKAFYYIKKLLNYALSFVSLIALILLIYSFYGLLIGEGDKQYSKVKSTLKGIAIAILVMGVARLIVSMLFRIYQNKAIEP